MAKITVTPINTHTFEVTVEGRTSTRHTVTLNHHDYLKLEGEKVPPERLVEKSFEFLLERESNTSILKQFELSVISRYFPEYEKTIVARL